MLDDDGRSQVDDGGSAGVGVETGGDGEVEEGVWSVGEGRVWIGEFERSFWVWFWEEEEDFRCFESCLRREIGGYAYIRSTR